HGGNDVFVTFKGSLTKLHFVWDVLFLSDILTERHQTKELFAQDMILALRQGLFSLLREDWIRNDDLNDISPATNHFNTAIRWAEDSVKYGCFGVWDGYIDSSGDLGSGWYALRGKMIVELQMAKTATRLANWLNMIFDDCSTSLYIET
ncbi:hypothetical protein HK100_011185, partial [Physocladia obscura]